MTPFDEIFEVISAPLFFALHRVVIIEPAAVRACVLWKGPFRTHVINNTYPASWAVAPLTIAIYAFDPFQFPEKQHGRV